MTFGLRRAKMLAKLFVQLVSKIFNVCGHDPPTLQTDRQTTCDSRTALCTVVHRAVKISRRKLDTKVDSNINLSDDRNNLGLCQMSQSLAQ